MAHKAHGHSSYSSLVFFHWSTRLLRPMETLEGVKADPVRAKEMLLHTFEIENQTFMYMKSPGI